MATEEPEMEYEAHGDIVSILIKYQDKSSTLHIDLQHMNDWTAKTLVEHILQDTNLCEPELQERDVQLVIKKSSGAEQTISRNQYIRDYTNMIDDDPAYYMEIYKLSREEGSGSST